MQQDKWMKVCAAACREHRKPTKQQCYDMALRLYPAEMMADQARKARRGHMAELASAMRTAANVDEQENGPTVQLALPGLQAPAYLTVPDEKNGLTLVEYAKSYRPERRAAIAIRKQVIGRIQVRVRDLQEKERYLNQLAPNDTTTVEDALKLAAKTKAPARRSTQPDRQGNAPRTRSAGRVDSTDTTENASV